MGDPGPTEGTNLRISISTKVFNGPHSAVQGESLPSTLSSFNEDGGLSDDQMSQYYSTNSSLTQFGFLDRLAILLNSECQNYFSRQYSSDINFNDSTFNRLSSSNISSDQNILNSTFLINNDNISDNSNVAVEDILFHLANMLFLLSYLAPPSRYGQVFLHSGLCIGFLIFATWAWNIVCEHVVFIWYFAFLVFNAGQLLYILYQMRPIMFDEDIETIYKNLFEPMTVTRAQFKKLLGRAAIKSGHAVDTSIPSITNSAAQLVNLHTGECYAIQNMTKTDRLALLVSGRINVLNDRAFLHHILPGEFLDSPEFESSGLNVGGNGGLGSSVEESTFKVTVCAAVPSRCIVWQRSALELLLIKDVHLATVMTTVISRDITNKLYSMNAKLKPKYKNGKDGGNLDIRLPGIAGRLSQMDARQLEQFVTKETEKRQKETSLEISDNPKNKLSLPSTFKRKYTQMKKITSKNQENQSVKNEASKDVNDSVTNLSDQNAKSNRNKNFGSSYSKANTLNSTSLRPPQLQPAGFLRKLSFRDRRGSTPSPFLNSNVETIIPISTKYLKVPSSPTSSPTIVPSNLE